LALGVKQRSKNTTLVLESNNNKEEEEQENKGRRKIHQAMTNVLKRMQLVVTRQCKESTGSSATNLAW
jgi:hypothetical protein